ncbi:MAG: undecaprenyl-diphosphate phosphatase, partial [Pseudomonadota bacterium]
MSPEQIIVLAIIQGITEFLPISSSGHLILIPAFTGWPDQGLATDVMVHVGSLVAVLAYFWRDVIGLARGTLNLARGKVTTEGKLAIYIVLATIPAVAFGIFLKSSGMSATLRSIEIIAWNAIIFGLLLYIADVVGKRVKVMEDMTFAPAILIGVAQALALIPGTSRSGATMTAARFLGFERAEAARFSFLLGIPAIAGAGLLTVKDFVDEGQGIPSDALWAAFLTFFSALAAIALLMAIVKRTSFLVFVIYRLALGLLLFALLYDWIP